MMMSDMPPGKKWINRINYDPPPKKKGRQMAPQRAMKSMGKEE